MSKNRVSGFFLQKSSAQKLNSHEGGCPVYSFFFLPSRFRPVSNPLPGVWWDGEVGRERCSKVTRIGGTIPKGSDAWGHYFSKERK